MEAHRLRVVIPEDHRAMVEQTAGKLKAEWRRISLADSFTLALALLENGTVLTSDHHELNPIAQAAVCPIRFIR